MPKNSPNKFRLLLKYHYEDIFALRDIVLKNKQKTFKEQQNLLRKDIVLRKKETNA